MKQVYKIILFIFLGGIPAATFAQEDVILLTDTLDQFFSSNKRIRITNQKKWFFKSGSDPQNAISPLDTTEWIRMYPRQMKKGFANEEGILEGWFRTKIKIDSSSSLTLGSSYIDVVTHFSAIEIYLDGKKIHTIGNIGTNRGDFKKVDTHLSHSMTALNLIPGQVHELAIHFKIVLPKFPLNLWVENHYLYVLVAIAKTESRESFWKLYNWTILLHALAGAAFIMVGILFWILFLQIEEQPIYKDIALFNFSWFFLITSQASNFLVDMNLSLYILINSIVGVLIFLSFYLLLIIIIQLTTESAPKRISLIRLIYIGIFAIGFALDDSLSDLLIGIVLLFTIISVLYYLVKYRKQKQKSNRAIRNGIIITLLFLSLIFVLESLGSTYLRQLAIDPTNLSLLVFSYIFPISLLFYVAYKIKETLSDVKLNANKVVQIAEEKRTLLANQNTLLEAKVNERTIELQNSLANLKTTQAQLIQSEKMASLGELTAGIAHEIQNPLNFVNNFSQVSNELLDEMKEEIAEGNTEEVEEIISMLSQNIEKIHHHGERASGIVKGMLQHSRASKGEREPTDINALCDEYLRLAYHGVRAKDKSFNVEIKTSFDESLKKINVVPQDIGRVILNLITNAFYAVGERSKEGVEHFKPCVTVCTRKEDGTVVIEVKDNGTGISKDKIDKIFQPFFTTKPTGKGTGLGLSLSYDIVKAHGGEISVDSKPGEGSTFIIHLPLG